MLNSRFPDRRETIGGAVIVAVVVLLATSARATCFCTGTHTEGAQHCLADPNADNLKLGYLNQNGICMVTTVWDPDQCCWADDLGTCAAN